MFFRAVLFNPLLWPASSQPDAANVRCNNSLDGVTDYIGSFASASDDFDECLAPFFGMPYAEAKHFDVLGLRLLNTTLLIPASRVFGQHLYTFCTLARELHSDPYGVNSLITDLGGSLPSRAVALDIGCNFGIVALLLARRVVGLGKIACIEPVEESLDVARELAALNGLADRFLFVNAAVTADANIVSLGDGSRLTLTMPGNDSCLNGGIRAPLLEARSAIQKPNRSESIREVEVRAIGFTELMGQVLGDMKPFDHPPVVWMKLDCEGCEFSLFSLSNVEKVVPRLREVFRGRFAGELHIDEISLLKNPGWQGHWVPPFRTLCYRCTSWDPLDLQRCTNVALNPYMRQCQTAVFFESHFPIAGTEREEMLRWYDQHFIL